MDYSSRRNFPNSPSIRPTTNINESWRSGKNAFEDWLSRRLSVFIKHWNRSTESNKQETRNEGMISLSKSQNKNTFSKGKNRKGLKQNKNFSGKTISCFIRPIRKKGQGLKMYPILKSLILMLNLLRENNCFYSLHLFLRDTQILNFSISSLLTSLHYLFIFLLSY